MIRKKIQSISVTPNDNGTHQVISNSDLLWVNVRTVTVIRPETIYATDKSKLINNPQSLDIHYATFSCGTVITVRQQELDKLLDLP